MFLKYRFHRFPTNRAWFDVMQSPLPVKMTHWNLESWLIFIFITSLAQTAKRVKRNLYQFGKMINCATVRSWTDYIGYGCYCGWGGSGNAVDDTDRLEAIAEHGRPDPGAGGLLI